MFIEFGVSSFWIFGFVCLFYADYTTSARNCDFIKDCIRRINNFLA